MEGYEVVGLEGDVGGGLVFVWEVFLFYNFLKIIKISFSIVVCLVGVGFGGFLRFVCLWIYLMFKIVYLMNFFIIFIVIDGKEYELKLSMVFGEFLIKGFNRFNGKVILNYNFLLICLIV